MRRINQNPDLPRNYREGRIATLVFGGLILAAMIVALTGCQFYRQKVTHPDGSTVENFAAQLPFADVNEGLFEARQSWKEDGSGDMVTGANVQQATTSEGLNVLTQTLGALALQGLMIYAQNPAAFRPPAPVAVPTPTPTPVPAAPLNPITLEGEHP